MASHASILPFSIASFSRSAVIALLTGAPPHCGVLTLAAHEGMLSCDLALLAVAAPGERAVSESATRLAVVCFQMDGPPSDDDHVKCGEAFRVAMEKFRLSHRPLALLGKKWMLDEAIETADSCSLLLKKVADVGLVSPEHHEDMVRVGEGFIRVAGQGREGYVRADALVEAMDGLMLMSAVFIKSSEYLPPYADTVPLSCLDVDKEVYFGDLIRAYTILYYALFWQFREAFPRNF